MKVSLIIKDVRGAKGIAFTFFREIAPFAGLTGP
jgi:hypothetical protein